MYKVTLDGKTIVGNNEDWITPNTQIWFENKDAGRYSVMYVGFMGMAQGAINEMGLVVDGFATNWLSVEKSNGKIEMDLDDALRTAMRTMNTVEEVKAYYESLDLSEMAQYQLVYIDKSGTYLIIEGDEMIIGDESEKTFSNFYYSQMSSIKDVPLAYYQRGIEYLDSTKSHVTRDYCSSVMKNMIQTDITATQYSTIYDLTEMKVRVYYYHDFEEFIELDLQEEFKKDDYEVNMADLFSDTSPGKQFYMNYNNPEKPYWLIENALGTADYSEEQLTQAGIPFLITMLGNEWYKGMNNTEAAIKVFKYGIDLMPNNAKLNSDLGKVYFETRDYNKAKRSFEKSLQLDQENESTKDFLKRIREIQRGH
ncbi:MAG: tetratricopeptide repeat protein [Chlamydiota bacterium]